MMIEFSEAQRDAALDGLCPVCGRGPWSSLAIHVAKAHGIPKRALKDALGVPWSHSLAEEDLSQRLADAARARDGAAVMQGHHVKMAGRPVSEAGRRGKAASGPKAAVKLRKVPEDAMPSLVERARSGEQLKVLAADVGLSPGGLTLRVQQWLASQGLPSRAEEIAAFTDGSQGTVGVDLLAARLGVDRTTVFWRMKHGHLHPDGRIWGVPWWREQA